MVINLNKMDSQFMALDVVVFVNLRVWVIWEAILENFIQYILLQMQIEDHTLKLVLHGSIYSKEWQFIFKRHVLPPWFHKKGCQAIGTIWPANYMLLLNKSLILWNNIFRTRFSAIFRNKNINFSEKTMSYAPTNLRVVTRVGPL